MGGRTRWFTEEYFWSKVDRTGDCWPWTGCKNWAGYGKVGVENQLKGTHRVAWELTNGPIPDGLHVCHRCDNPPCCNPDHLFLGTRSDNMRDAWAKGRGVHQVMHGEQHGMAKVTEADVREIRTRYAAGGVTQAALAAVYGISDVQVSNIVRHKNW